MTRLVSSDSVNDVEATVSAFCEEVHHCGGKVQRVEFSTCWGYNEAVWYSALIVGVLTDEQAKEVRSWQR